MLQKECLQRYRVPAKGIESTDGLNGAAAKISGGGVKEMLL